MLRLFSTIRKELLILFRDMGGLAIMFLMPVAMITIMALIQDAPFRDYQEVKISLVLMNKDTGSLGKSIEDGLNESKIFVIERSSGAESLLKEKISKGDFQVGIIIPADASESFNNKLKQFVSKTLAKSMGSDIEEDSIQSTDSIVNITIYFAPDIKKSFKASVMSSLKQFTSKLETQNLLEYFSKTLNKTDTASADKNEILSGFINFKEQDAVENNRENFQLNSVQHNVPAWTMFGMFFIVISMAGSIIKERDDGSYLRIRTMPGTYLTVLAGKITSYLFICMIQCILMLMVGIYLMPLLGLPELVIGTNIAAIALIAICSGLAATGYGIMVGTFFNTHQQASTFGAVSVIILAALGGIWIPVYIMPHAIRAIAEFSPLYWGLNAFQNIFLLHGNIQSVLPDALKLLLFFGLTTGVAFLFNKIRG